MNINTKNLKLLLLSAVLLLSLGISTTHATQIIFNLNNEFSEADEPVGTPPWLRATFDDEDTPGSVKLIMEAINLTDVEHVKQWYFNFNPNLTLSSTNFSFSSGEQAASFTVDEDNLKADGDGFFDFKFDWGANDFVQGSTAIYTISATDITAFDFNYLSINGPEGKTGFGSAAQIGGIGEDGEGSGWISAGEGQVGPEQTIPEPGPLALLSIGLLAMGWVSWRRRGV